MTEPARPLSKMTGGGCRAETAARSRASIDVCSDAVRCEALRVEVTRLRPPPYAALLVAHGWRPSVIEVSKVAAAKDFKSRTSVKNS